MTALGIINRFILIPLFRISIGHIVDEFEQDKVRWHHLWTGRHWRGTWQINRDAKWQAGQIGPTVPREQNPDYPAYVAEHGEPPR